MGIKWEGMRGVNRLMWSKNEIFIVLWENFHYLLP